MKSLDILRIEEGDAGGGGAGEAGGETVGGSGASKAGGDEAGGGGGGETGGDETGGGGGGEAGGNETEDRSRGGEAEGDVTGGDGAGNAGGVVASTPGEFKGGLGGSVGVYVGISARIN